MSLVFSFPYHNSYSKRLSTHTPRHPSRIYLSVRRPHFIRVWTSPSPAPKSQPPRQWVFLALSLFKYFWKRFKEKFLNYLAESSRIMGSLSSIRQGFTCVEEPGGPGWMNDLKIKERAGGYLGNHLIKHQHKSTLTLSTRSDALRLDLIYDEIQSAFKDWVI